MKKSEKFCSVEKVRCRSFHVSNRKNELFSTWADIGATCVFSSVFRSRPLHNEFRINLPKFHTRVTRNEKPSETRYNKVHMATWWTIRYGLMLLRFKDLMNVTEKLRNSQLRHTLCILKIDLTFQDKFVICNLIQSSSFFAIRVSS